MAQAHFPHTTPPLRLSAQHRSFKSDWSRSVRHTSTRCPCPSRRVDGCPRDEPICTDLSSGCRFGQQRDALAAAVSAGIRSTSSGASVEHALETSVQGKRELIGCCWFAFVFFFVFWFRIFNSVSYYPTFSCSSAGNKIIRPLRSNSWPT